MAKSKTQSSAKSERKAKNRAKSKAKKRRAKRIEAPAASATESPAKGSSSARSWLFAAAACIAALGVYQLWFAGSGPGGGPTPGVSGKNARAYLPGEDPSAYEVDALGPRKFEIIDVHEHLQTERDAKILIETMDALGVKRSCLQSSSHYTFTLDNQFGFERFKENNDKLIELKERYPGRFCAFVTIHPPDDGNLELLRSYVERGADGLKLYLGHGASHGKGPFHMMKLDDPRMRPIYAYAQKIQLPITFHVNLIKYFDEMVNVLELFPYLRVNIPHFGLHKNTDKRLARLAWLLGRYPNVYTDISFGWRDFHLQGFESLSANRERTRTWLEANKHKVLFASDLVIEVNKTKQHVDEVLRSYMQLLESEKFRFFMAKDQVMAGLALPDDVLRGIYEEAPKRYLMLDDEGRLRDRKAGWPAEGDVIPGLPPQVPEVPQPLDRSTIPPK